MTCYGYVQLQLDLSMHATFKSNQLVLLQEIVEKNMDVKRHIARIAAAEQASAAQHASHAPMSGCRSAQPLSQMSAPPMPAHPESSTPAADSASTFSTSVGSLSDSTLLSCDASSSTEVKSGASPGRVKRSIKLLQWPRKALVTATHVLSGKPAAPKASCAKEHHDKSASFAGRVIMHDDISMHNFGGRSGKRSLRVPFCFRAPATQS